MLESNPKYINFYSARRIIFVVVSVSLFFALPVIFFFFTVYNLSAYHPATFEELSDYIAIGVCSAVSFSLSATVVWVKRAFFSEFVGPLLPISIGGIIAFSLLIGFSLPVNRIELIAI